MKNEKLKEFISWLDNNTGYILRKSILVTGMAALSFAMKYKDVQYLVNNYKKISPTFIEYRQLENQFEHSKKEVAIFTTAFNNIQKTSIKNYQKDSNYNSKKLEKITIELSKEKAKMQNYKQELNRYEKTPTLNKIDKLSGKNYFGDLITVFLTNIWFWTITKRYEDKK